jgi:hypothetical protein
MDTLKASFDEVADWCERYLEGQRGPEIGMTFGAMLRAYARLATLVSPRRGEARAARERELNSKAEELLLQLSPHFVVSYGWVQQYDSRSTTRAPIGRARSTMTSPRSHSVARSAYSPRSFIDSKIRVSLGITRGSGQSCGVFDATALR